MSSEQNKSIVRRLFEEPWKGNLSVVDELTASEYIGHDPALPEPLRGPEGIKEFVSTYLVAFPDARITVEQQLAEGDLVATRWSARGTHEGELMDLEPTGTEITVTGLTISRLEGGKIVEEFQNWDFSGMVRQIEAAPALARA
jgi:predicted ester cyclase